MATFVEIKIQFSRFFQGLRIEILTLNLFCVQFKREIKQIWRLFPSECLTRIEILFELKKLGECHNFSICYNAFLFERVWPDFPQGKVLNRFVPLERESRTRIPAIFARTKKGNVYETQSWNIVAFVRSKKFHAKSQFFSTALTKRDRFIPTQFFYSNLHKKNECLFCNRNS